VRVNPRTCLARSTPAAPTERANPICLRTVHTRATCALARSDARKVAPHAGFPRSHDRLANFCGDLQVFHRP
jgi:hypothetical protein